MKIIGGIIILLVCGAVSYQFFHIYQQNQGLNTNLSKLYQEVDVLTKENKALQADLEYFANTDNLEKEIRARFNYKAPGENMIIVTPPNTH